MSLVILQALSSMFLFVAYVYIWKKLLPDLKFVLFFSPSIFKGLMKDGFWVSVSNIMNNILTQFDKFVMSAFWGPVYVSYYASAQMIPEKIQATSFSLSTSLFPVFSNISFLQDSEKIKNIFHRYIKIILLISASLATLVFVYGYWLLKYWLGQEFADNATIPMYILTVTYFLFSINVFMHFYLSGTRRLKFIAISTMSMAILNIVSMFLLVPSYKAVGASIAYLIGVLPIPFILFYVERKMLGFSTKKIIHFYTTNISKIVFVAIIIYLLSSLILTPYITNLFSVIILGGVSIVAFFGLFRLFGFFERDELELFKTFFNKAIKFRV